MESITTKLYEVCPILLPLGKGSFGEVFESTQVYNKLTAVKIEKNDKNPRLENEFKIYNYLYRKGFRYGIPIPYEFIETDDYNIMIMQKLGPSLEDLFTERDRKLDIPSVMMIADQIITLLEFLHTVDFIHRDIKPNNFLIGYKDTWQIYIMDFGLSKRYMQHKKHISFKDNKSLIGTARYASINMHRGIEPTRRDELESVGYMLVYFLKGRLPWQGLKKKGKNNQIDEIGKKKMETKLEDLCSNIPECFAQYIDYCRKLGFQEDPDYNYMRGLFRNYCLKNKINPRFEWVN